MTSLEDKCEKIPCIAAREMALLPSWAIWQRRLLERLYDAACEFVERYTYDDGTLRWKQHWPGMDGSDDAYEGFYGLPLLYLLGGDARLLPMARRQWDTITWQWTEYGQIYREFDGSYDWMHHGESNQYLYWLGLCDPASVQLRQRSVRFAGFYNGDDPTALNYDAEHRLIRAALHGSRGPHWTITAEDWSTHREVLEGYPPPFEDIPGVPGPHCPWTDDRVYAEILQRMNTRLTHGDIPVNLMATSLMAHTYTVTGEDRYRQWVLDYTAAWEERTARNGGILPDNVGLDDVIGQYLDGKWWGGFFGWCWPYGADVLLEPVIVGSCNAFLLDHGQSARLKLIRSQLDMLWNLGHEENGTWVVPHKHLNRGWIQYQPLRPDLPFYTWFVSQEEEDLQRLLRLGKSIEATHPLEKRTKSNGWVNNVPWFNYIRGQNPDYPTQILQVNYTQMLQRLEMIRADEADQTTLNVHHWQDMSPLLCEGLVQTMLGAPLPVLEGGLPFLTVRYYDAQARRPGLPPQVSALVEHLDAHSVTLHLVNLDVRQEQEVIVQAGGFGEHIFHQASVLADDGSRGIAHPIEGKWLQVSLAPGSGIRLDVEMSRFVHHPSAETPWLSLPEYPPLLQGREEYKA